MESLPQNAAGVLKNQKVVLVKLWADTICLFILVTFLWCVPSVAQENASVKLYFSLTRKALQNNDFNSAFDYFGNVKKSLPEDSDVATIYLDLMTLRNSPVSVSFKERVIQNIDSLENKFSDEKVSVPEKSQELERIQRKTMEQDSNSGDVKTSAENNTNSINDKQESWIDHVKERLYGKKYWFYLNKTKPIDQRIQEMESEVQSFEIELDDDLWATQPKTEISVKVGQTVVIKGSAIKRFLNTRPEFINLKKINDETLELTSQTTVSVPIYIWEQHGRWTLNIQGFSRSTLYRQLAEADEKTKEVVQSDTFKFKYSSNGDVRYEGESLSSLNSTGSRSLSSLSTIGSTPYGGLDSKLDWGSQSGNREITYFTVGLSDGIVGALKDFNLRLFDFSTNLSPHTFGYSSLRGAYLDKSFANDRFKVTAFSGKERSLSVISLSQDSQNRNVDYQGTKFDFFDKHSGRYSLNYIQRGGQEIDDAADQAYAFDFNKQIRAFNFGGELASDSENLAKTLTIGYNDGRYGTLFHLYDIDEDFLAISGAAGDQGRIGLKWEGSVYHQNQFDLNLGTNVYKERTFSLDDRKDELNYENFFNYSMPITETLSFSSTNLYNILNSGYSPSKYLSNNNAVSKNFTIFHRKSDLSVNVGYNTNRNELNSASDYDRYVLGTSFNMQINKRLLWSNNYQYNIQKDLDTGLKSQPSSLITGLDYSKRINDRVKLSWRTSYKKELSQSESPNFYAVDDRFSVAAGISYKPAPEVTTYVTGEWNQDVGSDSDDASDVSLKWGVEAAWDSLVSWSPRGVVEGVVYRDLDQNGRQDENEPGLPGMVVRVGDKNYITDSEGRFATYVRAKEVRVMLKSENFPKGYNYSDSLIKKIVIVPNGVHTIYFPLSSNTAILGAVFMDDNGNGVFDREEQGFRGVNIKVDGESQKTDYKGSFLFPKLAPGQHKLRIDVNSLPADYIPKVKIQQVIDLTEGDTSIINIPLVQKNKN